MAFDPYYSRPEVSNSDLTALKYKLFPQLNFVSENAKLEAFRMGTLVDALITEPKKINFYKNTIDEYSYTKEEMAWGQKMRKALLKEATKDKFLDFVLKYSDSQKWFTNPAQKFDLGFMQIELPTRCKWDWWLGTFGGDLKTTSATTQAQFEAQIDFVDWDRSRVFYMMLCRSINPAWCGQDFIYAISKKNFKVFRKKIVWGDELFERGRKKLNDLVFRAWCLT